MGVLCTYICCQKEKKKIRMYLIECSSFPVWAGREDMMSGIGYNNVLIKITRVRSEIKEGCQKRR